MFQSIRCDWHSLSRTTPRRGSRGRFSFPILRSQVDTSYRQNYILLGCKFTRDLDVVVYAKLKIDIGGSTGNPESWGKCLFSGDMPSLFFMYFREFHHHVSILGCNGMTTYGLFTSTNGLSSFQDMMMGTHIASRGKHFAFFHNLDTSFDTNNIYLNR